MQKLIKYLSSSVELEPHGESLTVRTPIMYFGADHTFSFRIEHSGVDGYLISDCGQTLDYLRECADVSVYSDRIMDIARRFALNLDVDALTAFIPSVDSGQTGRSIHKYLLGVGIIANIYLI